MCVCVCVCAYTHRALGGDHGRPKRDCAGLIHNVYTTIPGADYAKDDDRMVVLGNHRDAWYFFFFISIFLRFVFYFYFWRNHRAITANAWYFSKVCFIVSLHSKYTRAQTFENLCQGRLGGGPQSSPPATKAGSPSEELPTGLPADGGTRARSRGQVREHQVCESSHPHTSSTTQAKVTAGDTLSRMSSSASSRSDLGPFSALRSFDDADPRELAGEGWDSDADWGYGNPRVRYRRHDSSG